MENLDINTNQLAETRNRIIDAFIEHVLETGKQPVSVYKFAKNLGITEEEFYHYFTSFQGVKGAVWDRIFDETYATMRAQEVYQAYSAKEKLLSFYYTWIEVLKKHRSYLLALYEGHADFKKITPQEVRSFRENFKTFAKGIILEGKTEGEIVDRKYISDKYDEALWLETLFIFQFWLRDTSVSFEKTDVAIEKSVRLAFDLIGRTAVDSFVDLAKFLYQSK
ncbi:TetR/AcrR family transcriptional regulator [Rufibacter sediminis]|uniref:TetR/AcrR family transcriptional regulator n=1 Tax=Rufibacter sediminis TaxID=2762756 RepID=A0ABR6VR11_9BACT|nr:TetR family transcriptional regulator C-terminal domain-containing protein [Rufibacter sediminis]MBC3539288.1 TetR/AcrR family transcriptional regulator [Rufibacter sediminis]